jgi:hypothetical protein
VWFERRAANGAYDNVPRVPFPARVEEAMSIQRFASTIAIAATVLCSAAQAADDTRYISRTGDNVNACTLAKPCRTLQRGISTTPAGGELRILDSGSYGNNVTIGKSLTISGNGNTVFLNGFLTVNPGAGAAVTLRDLTLNGQGTINVGVSIDLAAAVHIERCVFHGFTGDGIFVHGAGTRIFVIDTISRDNGGDGLRVGGGTIALISNSTFTNNTHGLHNLGILESRQNNTVRGNEVDVFDGGGTFTPVGGI